MGRRKKIIETEINPEIKESDPEMDLNEGETPSDSSEEYILEFDTSPSAKTAFSYTQPPDPPAAKYGAGTKACPWKCNRCGADIKSSPWSITQISATSLIGMSYYRTDNVPDRLRLCEKCCEEWATEFEKWYFKKESAIGRFNVR